MEAHLHLVSMNPLSGFDEHERRGGAWWRWWTSTRHRGTRQQGIDLVSPCRGETTDPSGLLEAARTEPIDPWSMNVKEVVGSTGRELSWWEEGMR